jgi:hypothetical protein
MSKQKELNEKMREMLVDWLIEVATKFHLLQESLFLGIAIMDTFFSKKQGKSHLVDFLELLFIYICVVLIYSGEVEDAAGGSRSAVHRDQVRGDLVPVDR